MWKNKARLCEACAGFYLYSGIIQVSRRRCERRLRRSSASIIHLNECWTGSQGRLEDEHAAVYLCRWNDGCVARGPHGNDRRSSSVRCAKRRRAKWSCAQSTWCEQVDATRHYKQRSLHYKGGAGAASEQTTTPGSR